MSLEGISHHVRLVAAEFMPEWRLIKRVFATLQVQCGRLRIVPGIYRKVCRYPCGYQVSVYVYACCGISGSGLRLDSSKRTLSPVTVEKYCYTTIHFRVPQQFTLEFLNKWATMQALGILLQCFRFGIVRLRFSSGEDGSKGVPSTASEDLGV